MTRLFTIASGLLAALIGLIMLGVAHSRDAACTIVASADVGQGVGPVCQKVVSTYLGGFVLVVSGLAVVMVVVGASSRVVRRTKRPMSPTVTRAHWEAHVTPTHGHHVR